MLFRSLYRGQADREAFARCLPQCAAPVCYNGDIAGPEELAGLEARFPSLSGVMVGRGLMADPALLRRAAGGPAMTKAELRGYLEQLYQGYTQLFGSAGCAVSRMKAHWQYLLPRFEGADRLEKPLRKAREPWEYQVVVDQIFTRELLP